MNRGKKIVVVGGGATGHVLIADLTLAGHEVMWYEQPKYAQPWEAVKQAKGVNLIGSARTGFAKLLHFTHDPAEAMAWGDLIIVSVVAQRHDQLAILTAPYVRDDQVFIFSPGNVGSLVFSKIWREKKINTHPIVADLESSFFAARLSGPAEATIPLPGRVKFISAFPAINTDLVIKALKGVYQVVAAENIMEATLNSPNIDSHLIGSLLNSGGIERAAGKFMFYRDGLSPAVIKCIEKVHQEKKAVFDAFGWTDRSQPKHLHKLGQTDSYPELDPLRNAAGPSGLRHRYVHEDAFAGAALIVSLGQITRVATPVIRAALELASEINSCDYLQIGRTLENLCPKINTKRELNIFLREGYESDD